MEHSRMFYLASFICERTLQELDTLHFLPSMVAASAIYLARKNLHMRPWVSGETASCHVLYLLPEGEVSHHKVLACAERNPRPLHTLHGGDAAPLPPRHQPLGHLSLSKPGGTYPAGSTSRLEHDQLLTARRTEFSALQAVKNKYSGSKYMKVAAGELVGIM